MNIKCQDCGKPYMTGLKFVHDGNCIRCKRCYDEVVEERKKTGNRFLERWVE